MKKVILTSVLATVALSSFNANAATGTANVCSGVSPGAAGTSVASGTDMFVKITFAPKCSSNVWLYSNDQNTYFGVGSASTKGKTVWTGSTAGGGVSSNASCVATGCTSTQAQTAASNAPSS